MTTGIVGQTNNPNKRDSFSNIENITFIGSFDTLLTGDGNANIIAGGSGNDIINTGSGGDVVIYKGEGNDTITFGAGMILLRSATSPVGQSTEMVMI